jgi:hypothetical protein
LATRDDLQRAISSDFRLAIDTRVVPRLSLLPLTDNDYGDFAECQVVQSARQRVEAGEWTLADAHQRARAEQADLLADQLCGQGHTLLRGSKPQVARWSAGCGLVQSGFLERYGVRDLRRARWPSQITVRDELRGRGHSQAIRQPRVFGRLRDQL